MPASSRKCQNRLTLAAAIGKLAAMQSPPIRTLKDARAIAGTLSVPSKMPGHGYGLPARECITGTRLRAVAGSTCSGCYAMKGRYVFPNVQGAQYKRLAAIEDPRWTDAMVFMIDRTGDAFFRWHDSGDLQSVDHLSRIMDVCRRTPNVRHWLPTREVRILRDWVKANGRDAVPANLTIRVSAHMVGQVPPRAPMGLPFSTVSTPNTRALMADAHMCPAPKQGNECGDCRACWDGNVPHVDYAKH